MPTHLILAALSLALLLSGCTALPNQNSPYDLAVTAASSSPTTPQDGQPLTLTFQIANNDTDGSTLTTIPWSVSRDGVSDFQTGTIASLAAGASTTQTVTFVESGGSHTYGIQVDPGNSIGEANMANNTWFLFVTVAGAPATLDLSFSGTPTISPSDANTAELITIAFAIQDTSSAGTAATNVQYSVTRDGVPGFQSGIIGNLAANASQAASVEFTEGTPGNHTYVVIIDPDNSIAESDEGNNSFELQATVAAVGFAQR